ncbi:MAG TPA: ABC transporter permease subunit [Pseudobdellovibrionaceae bacterium]|nr:ABC transporter permease subunit [Pseudobdellovibrionaceae bacterium]
MNPLFFKRWNRFKSLRRSFWSLVILMGAIFLSLFAELLMNHRAIFVNYKGQWHFPTYQYLEAQTFGEEGTQEPKYRELKTKLSENGEGFVLMPLVPYGPFESDFTETPPPHAPSSRHWLGTDDQGRDILVRLFYGFRIAIFFSLILTIVGFIIGIWIGALSGYFGGWVDLSFQRIIEIWSTVPFLYLCIYVASLITPNFWILLCLLLFFSWISISYYIRTEVMREKEKDYCLAAQSCGASSSRIIFKHLLPNSMVPVISSFPFAIVRGITSLTSLDFLGYGLPPPTPSWGGLMQQGLQYLHNAWWITLFSFLAITITLLLVTFIGEGIREALDPKHFSKYQ